MVKKSRVSNSSWQETVVVDLPERGPVEALIYWRDPKKSGPVFAGVLIILLSLSYFSFISVIAYISLLALSATIAFRIYKNVLQAVQKTSDGHPFKEYLEMDLSLSQEKMTDLVDFGLSIVNVGISELRRLFLVEDLIDSMKFGILLWCLTYVGSWFNGMTLVIIAFIALFTLPKVYENNKAQIDANIEIVRSKLAEITCKMSLVSFIASFLYSFCCFKCCCSKYWVKAAIPMGKKEPEKAKEQ